MFRICKKKTIWRVIYICTFPLFPLAVFLPLIVWAFHFPLVGILADYTADPMFGYEQFPSVSDFTSTW